MSHRPIARTLRIKHLLHADALCLWRAAPDRVALPSECEPAGLLTDPFALPDVDQDSLDFQEGPTAVRLLPLAVRAGLKPPSPDFAALRTVGQHDCGFFAFWTDRGRIPMSYQEISRFVLREWELEVEREQALERLDRVSASLHDPAFALPQGLALAPKGQEPGLVNPAAARWLQLPPGDVEGATLAEALRNLLDRAEDPEPVRRQVQAVLRGEVDHAKDLLLRLKGDQVVLQFTLAALGSTGHPGWVWLLDEVSEPA